MKVGVSEDNHEWWSDIQGPDVRLSLRVSEPIHREESEFQSIEILKTREFGVTLVLDGALQTTEKDEFFYHEQLVHPAVMLAPDRDLNVVIIGGGDGGAAREFLKYNHVKRVQMVEIDERVVALTRQYLPSLWRHPDGGMIYNDPRLHVTIGDGLAWIREQSREKEKADILIGDISDPTGPSLNIFGEEFYRNARRMVAEDGVFTLQAESPVALRGFHNEIFHTVRSVFPGSKRYFGPVPTYPGSIWSYCISAEDPALKEHTHFTEVVERFEACRKSGVLYKFYDPHWHRSAFTWEYPCEEEEHHDSHMYRK